MLKRIDHIDIAKGIGIILVVFEHSNLPGATYHGAIINSFHMALFYVLSSLFVNTSNWNVFLKNKYNRLIKPYIIWSLTALSVYLLVTTDVENISEQLLRFLFGMRDHKYMFTSTLWFCTSLFSAMVLFKWLITNKLRALIGWCVCVAMSIILSHYKIILPLNFDVSIFFVPMMLIVYKYRDNLLDFKPSSTLAVISSIIMAIHVILSKIFVSVNINIYDCSFGLWPENYIVAFAGIYLVLSVAYLIKDGKMGRILKYIGENSIIIFIIHQAFLLHPLNCYGVVYSDILLSFIRFIIVMLISIVCIPLINKYLKFSIR